MDSFLATKPGVPALIDELDRISIRDGNMAGDGMLAGSPIVKALIEAGDSAVEPLLQCLASDRRLTRVVHVRQEYPQGQTLLGVHEAALEALEGIFETTWFSPATTGDNFTARGDKARAAAVAAIRADWEKYHKTTGIERVYQILADDGGTPAGWLSAAGALFHTAVSPPDSGKPAGRIPGDTLRGKTAPSVADLLEKRVENGARKSGRVADAEVVRCQMLVYLLWWDPQRGREAIIRQTGDWIKRETWKSDPVLLKSFVSDVAPEVPEVLGIFEKMAWTLQPGDYLDFHRGETVTGILKNNSGSSLLARTRESLWTDPQSPWCLGQLNRANLEELLGVWRDEKVTRDEPFRGALVMLLADASECATLSLDPKQPRMWVIRNSTTEVFSRPVPTDPRFALKPGETMAIRRADVVAKLLGDPAEGAPSPGREAMEYWWTLEARDARIAEVLKEIRSE